MFWIYSNVLFSIEQLHFQVCRLFQQKLCPNFHRRQSHVLGSSPIVTYPPPTPPAGAMGSDATVRG